MVLVAVSLVSVLMFVSSANKKVSEKKTVITILAMEMPSSMELYWIHLASRFPEVKFNIIVPSSIMMEEELRRRVKHADVADITFSKHLDTSLYNMSTTFSDLSGKSYTSRYQISYLQDLDLNGKVYYLPVELTVGGVIYNATLFEENGWSVPRNYDEFKKICDACEVQGIRPVFLSYGTRMEADTFVKCFAVGKGQTLKGKQWLDQFNRKEATVKDGGLEDVFAVLEQYRKDGMIKGDEPDIVRREKSRMLAERETAMLGGDASQLMDIRYEGGNDEYRLMPFFSNVDGKGYFFSYPVLKLAVGKHVEEDEEKVAIIDQILDYMISEEGQRDFMEYDKGVISPIFGMQFLVEGDFYEQLQSELPQEGLQVLPVFKNCMDVLHQGIRGYLNGKMTMEQVMEALEQENWSGNYGETQPILSEAETDFTIGETSVLVLEAMRQGLGTDIALMIQVDQAGHLAAQGVNGRIYKGIITMTDIYCIYPGVKDMREEGRIDQVVFSGEQLLEILSYHNPYFYTGITVKYKWDKEQENYIAVGLYDEDGTELPLDEEYTAALLERSNIPESHYLSRTETSKVLLDVIVEHITSEPIWKPSQVNPAIYESNLGRQL